jgi:hypothetical protein
MSVVVDHVFICTAAGAPAADRLLQFGLTGGSPNRHPGQGTACRRFFFRNAMLEMLWLEDNTEAQNEQTRRTKLWERCSAAGREASPFGITLRPETSASCPFPSWEYRPKTMPGLMLQIAEDAGLQEPMWCYMERGRAPAEASIEKRQPLEHAAGFRDVTAVHVVGPQLSATSVTRAMAVKKVITVETGAEHLLELQFDGGTESRHIDFRPDLPLVFRW